MPSSPTTRLRFNLQATGENSGTWGDTLNNQALALIDEALAGVETIALSGNLTLTATNYVSDQARNPVLIFTSSGLVSAPTVTVPTVEKWYLIRNTTAYAITIDGNGMTDGIVPAGRDCFVLVNSSGSVAVIDFAGASATSAAAAAASAASALASSILADADATQTALDRIAAAASAVASAAFYDSFDDRYLGAKSSAPTLDNDGNALITGAIYWDTVFASMYVWTGSAWSVFIPGAASYYTKTQTDALFAALPTTARTVARIIAYAGAR